MSTGRIASRMRRPRSRSRGRRRRLRPRGERPDRELDVLRDCVARVSGIVVGEPRDAQARHHDVGDRAERYRDHSGIDAVKPGEKTTLRQSGSHLGGSKPRGGVRSGPSSPPAVAPSSCVPSPAGRTRSVEGCHAAALSLLMHDGLPDVRGDQSGARSRSQISMSGARRAEVSARTPRCELPRSPVRPRSRRGPRQGAPQSHIGRCCVVHVLSPRLGHRRDHLDHQERPASER
jgi:hypothetical protein